MTSVPEDTLTWPMLIATARTGKGSTARHEVGEWAIEQLRRVLGEDWPQRWLARFGCPPTFIADAPSDAAAYALLLETAFA